MSEKDGGPAFPTLAFSHGLEGERRPVPTNYSGMSLRDYFAAKALVGFLASPGRETADAVVIARGCFHLADAMLAERAK